MDNKLTQYASGERRPRGADKALAAVAKPVYDDARLAALKVDGSIALAGHAMKAMEGLDDLRRDLAAGDPVKNEILSDLEVECVRQVKKIQAGLYNEFGI